MSTKSTGVEITTKKSISAQISNLGLTNLKDEFVELTMWANGEGIDIYFSKGCVDKLPIRLSLSFEEATILRKAIKIMETI